MMKEFEDFLREAKCELRDAQYSEHPSEDLIEAYVFEALSGAVRSRVAAHIATCPHCREKVTQWRPEVERLIDSLAPLRAEVQEKVFEQLQLGRPEQGIQEAQAHVPREREGWWQRLWGGPWLRSRKAFWVHAAAYALASGALAALWLIAGIPEFQLQGGESGASVWGLIRSLLGRLGVIWGLWGVLIMIHALRAFRSSRPSSRR